MSLSTTVLKSAVLAAVLCVTAGHAFAKGTASDPVSLGLLGNDDTKFGNTFNGTSTFTDYYSFTIGGTSNGASGSTFETAWTFFVAGVDVTSITLSGGSLSSSVVDSTPGSFSFTGLGVGTYTMAVSGNTTFGLLSGNYNGTIHAVTNATSPVASPAPEPADFAMALMGLAGVGYMVRRRSAA